jgi:hypothetical protein
MIGSKTNFKFCGTSYHQHSRIKQIHDSCKTIGTDDFVSNKQKRDIDTTDTKLGNRNETERRFGIAAEKSRTFVFLYLF